MKLQVRDFRIIVCTHRDCLLISWSTSKIDRIEQVFEELIFFIDPRRHSRSLWMSVIVPWDSRTADRTLAVAFRCCKTSAAAWPPYFQELLRLRVTPPSLSMSRMISGRCSQDYRWRAYYMPINLYCNKLLILNKTLVFMEFIYGHK